MSNSEFEARAAELVDAGRELHRLGWVPATSGNLSARLSDGSLAVTVSGKHKGRLAEADIMRVDAEGRSLDGRSPSAETLLHVGIYRRFPDIHAVLHPHAPAGVALSRVRTGPIVLRGYELLKALRGIQTHEVAVTVPVFPNDQDIRRLAGVVDAYFDQANQPIYAYLIASHGLYTWGASVGEALRQVEALECLFDIELRIAGGVPA